MHIDDFSIAMINTNFSLNFTVNLYRVFESFQAAGHDTTYNPDRYAAVKVKMEVTPKRFITASIFGSGKVIMTGARCLEEISLTYGTIMQVVAANKYSVYDEKIDNPEKFEMYRGVPIPVWLEKISESTIKNNV
jgi:TATA-box binding protein (TBP) (component of TFIID and TFIIIB)